MGAETGLFGRNEMSIVKSTSLRIEKLQCELVVPHADFISMKLRDFVRATSCRCYSCNEALCAH